MHEIDLLVSWAELTSGDSFSTVWSRIYGYWITDEVIDTEVIRNIMLALVCVMACTSILIVNFQVCFYIFMCVLLTLVSALLLDIFFIDDEYDIFFLSRLAYADLCICGV